MFRVIENILTSEEIRRLRDLALETRFVEGLATNPGSKVKNNLQVPHDDPKLEEPGQIVRAAIFRNPALRQFAFPKRLARPTLCKYEPGMKYGWHVDEAMFPSQPTPMRSDMSCTIFISEPDSYQGGELEIELGDQRIEVKAAPGAGVFYPSTTVHQVKEVTSGERLVAIAWIQCFVADMEKRELLSTVNDVFAREFGRLDDRSKVDLEKLRTNLFRMWADV